MAKGHCIITQAGEADGDGMLATLQRTLQRTLQGPLGGLVIPFMGDDLSCLRFLTTLWRLALQQIIPTFRCLSCEVEVLVDACNSYRNYDNILPFS
jgi:hypothetical protein